MVYLWFLLHFVDAVVYLADVKEGATGVWCGRVTSANI